MSRLVDSPVGARWILGASVLIAAGCGGEPGDGFQSYSRCHVDDGEACVMLWGVSETAERYEVVVVSESPAEVRVLVDASGEKLDDDLVRGVRAFLDQPLGDRVIVDHTTGERVPLNEQEDRAFRR
ncbi:MAG: hypothetical protein AAGA93_00635 [Actinomycetota bacterium]